VLLVVVVIFELRKRLGAYSSMFVRAAAGTCGYGPRRTARGRRFVSCVDSCVGIGLDRFRGTDLGFLFRPPVCRAGKSFPNDLQVQLAHTRDDEFLGLSVAIEPERLILLRRLCASADSFVSSPRLFGETARPTMAWDTSSAAVDSRRAPCRVEFLHFGHGHDLSRAPESTVRSVRLNLQQRPDLDTLRAVLAGTVSSSSECRRRRDEAQLLHERIDAGLEDLGDQGFGWSGMISASWPSLLALRSSRRGGSTGHEASINS